MRSRILSIYKALAVEVNHPDLICLAMDQLLSGTTRVASLTMKLRWSPPVPSLRTAVKAIENRI